MDSAMALINAAVCGLIATALVALILSPRVNDGIVIKSGLICMALGFGAVAVRMADGLRAEDALHLARAILLINLGLLLAAGGYALRRKRARRPLRRASDWLRHEEGVRWN